MKRDMKVKCERLGIALNRYFGALTATVKCFLFYPFGKFKSLNRFCFGVQALQDEMEYSCPLIHSKALHEVFPGIENVTIKTGLVFPWEGSSISAYETLSIGAIIQHLKPHRVFEIGTSVGVTASNLAINLPDGGELYTLDLPPVTGDGANIVTKFDVTVSDRKMIYGNRVSRRFLGTPLEPKINQLYGDSATFDYSDHIGQCDVVFVDGSHAYAYVKSDTEIAYKLAKPGGWVIWHDYNDGFFWPDVRKYLKTIAKERKIFRIEGTMFAISQA